MIFIPDCHSVLYKVIIEEFAYFKLRMKIVLNKVKMTFRLKI